MNSFFFFLYTHQQISLSVCLSVALTRILTHAQLKAGCSVFQVGIAARRTPRSSFPRRDTCGSASNRTKPSSTRASEPCTISTSPTPKVSTENAPTDRIALLKARVRFRSGTLDGCTYTQRGQSRLISQTILHSMELEIGFA